MHARTDTYSGGDRSGYSGGSGTTGRYSDSAEPEGGGGYRYSGYPRLEAVQLRAIVD